ncbi:hypothetical protein [Ornithinibacillus halophilus]|uniref:Uncharacterized protein n=1 Tax=Ornithinibacillus halophilus TaxID=930117 RepID=A0A1M5FW26_9BACI|nr:hypothetical protein [Ornithinibacillus halophilus]SHF95584.1 hypothetical protein SAMN05216225_101052 [Ornithinibacillus halophilus]
MAKKRKKKNQSQQPQASELTNNAADTEFGVEFTQSKKARKRAAREKKKQQNK